MLRGYAVIVTPVQIYISKFESHSILKVNTCRVHKPKIIHALVNNDVHPLAFCLE